MAGKILSIEVEQSITRVVEMDYGVKSPRIYNAFSFETPPGTLSDEGVTVNETMVGLMRQGLTQNGIHTNKAIFALASSRIASKEVIIPTVKDNKIKQVLLANSKDYFPVDLSQYELVYRILERMKAENQLKLMVYAVPRGLLLSYQQLAKAWGFQLIGVDYSGNSIHQAMMRTMNPALAVTVCVEDQNSMLTIVKDGKVDFQRPISYGIDDAVEVIRTGGAAGAGAEYASPEAPGQSPGMTYSEALSLMRSKNYLNKQLRASGASGESDDWDDVEDPETMELREKVTREFEMLIGSLSRVFDYYTSRNPEVEIEEIRLAGLAADCQGLDSLLSNELGVRVTILRDSRIGVSRNLMRNKFKLAEYIVAVGATFEPLNFELASAGGQKSSSKSGGSFALPVIVLVGGIVLSGVLLGLEFMNIMSLAVDNAVMTEDINRKLPVVEVYNNYLIQKKTVTGLRAADHNSDVPNDLFLRFLSDMEVNMPSDLMIDSLSVTEDTMTISALCRSKESAAKAIMQLRSFDTVLQVACSSVTDEDSEGIVMERIEIALTYLPKELVEAKDKENSTESTENTEGGAGSEAE